MSPVFRHQQFVFTVRHLCGLLAGRFISGMWRFDRFVLDSGWSSALSTGAEPRLANPTLLC